MNLYRGCQHGCIYCDTRSDCYGIGELSDIRFKRNAVTLLEKELAGRRRRGTVTTGSMHDPYMPVEKTAELTREALRRLALHRFGVHVITKSDLVTRDIDILTEIGRTYAAVSLTVTTSDDALAGRLEPGAPSPSKRFAAMAKLARSGIYAGITLMPTLPWITDDPEALRDLIRRAADSGARYILFLPGMTLRDTCRSYFYNQLDKGFPSLRPMYEKRFGNSYVCDAPNAGRLWQIFQEECSKAGIATLMRFYTPPPDKPRPAQLSLFD